MLGGPIEDPGDIHEWLKGRREAISRSPTKAFKACLGDDDMERAMAIAMPSSVYLDAKTMFAGQTGGSVDKGARAAVQMRALASADKAQPDILKMQVRASARSPCDAASLRCSIVSPWMLAISAIARSDRARSDPSLPSMSSLQLTCSLLHPGR